MLVETEKGIKKLRGGYDHSIDLIHDVSEEKTYFGGKTKTGGDYTILYFMRVADEDRFFEILESGWESKIGSNKV